MANTKTQTTKTQKAAAKVSAPKASKNTPTVKKEAKSEARKPHIFALVAGMVRKVEHKGMKQAIKYHVSKGNLALTESGIKLTEQGAMLWAKDRVSLDPAKFQEVAAFINGGDIPKEWKGQPVTQIADGIQFPNMLYWGSFSSGIMRQAFAAIWAK